MEITTTTFSAAKTIATANTAVQHSDSGNNSNKTPTIQNFEEGLARDLGVSLRELQFTSKYQIEKIADKTIMDFFIRVNTLTDQTYRRMKNTEISGKMTRSTSATNGDYHI